MSNERKIQKSFIDQVKGKKKVKESSIGVYKYLVHHSFFEVISNAYPLFYEIVKEKNLEKEFDKSIFKFMQTKAYSPYIWEMPNEYRKFIKKSNYFKNLKYLNDLLHFEYSELFIFMKKVPNKQKHQFKMSKNYNLSNDLSLHRYKYDVINNNYNEKGEYFILGYFDNNTNEVVYRPLNILLYTFLKSLNKEQTLKVNLRLFLKKNKIPFKQYAQDFSQVLEELYHQEVII